MKLVFLTQYFPPEMGAPQARISEMALRLHRRGHNVSIITAMPNYPTGAIFPAYKGLQKVKERYEGLDVLRCWIFPTKTTKIIPRLVSYFSFVFSSIFFGPSIGKQDVIVVESPPLFLGISGIYLAWRLKAKLIFNVSDLWPDSAIELGVTSNKFFIYWARKLEQLCYKKAVAISGQSPSIVETIQHRTKGKIVELITNGADTTIFSPSHKDISIKKKYGIENKFVIVYAGLFGIAQGLGLILDVARMLKDNLEIVFLLVGDGPEKKHLEVEAERLTNVKIFPPMPKSNIAEILATMDLSIIPLKTIIRGAVPSKIYEAMASGVPIIFMGSGDGADIINSSGAGVVLDSGDIKGVLQTIHRLKENPSLRREMSQNGVKTAAFYSRDNIVNRFESLLQKINQFG
jgi:glycosyltransferase involved in cell wall biosynthesis